MTKNKTVTALATLTALAGAALAGPSARATEKVQGAWYDDSAEFPVPVMHLEGSIEQVARAHGQLLAKHPEKKATLHYLGTLVEHKLAQSSALSNPLLRAGVSWLYRHFIRNPMIEHTPERYRAAYKEFASAAGVDEDEVWDALVLPDAALRSVSLLYKTELGPVLPPSFGCTSLIWNSGQATVLHGRNLDYEGIGLWDKNQLIMHVIPQEGLAYVAITAMGVHAPGITAFNEAGLTLSIHQLTFDDAQAGGTPMAVISAEIIRDARGIDDAIAIIKGFPRAGGWAYVLSQGQDRAVVESSAGELAIRRSSERFFFQTNHVSSPALAKHEIFYTPGSWLDSHERADTLKAYGRSGRATGFATPARIAALIGAHEASGKPRVAGGITAKLDNIQSVIMDASRRRLWVAVGDKGAAPNAPNEGRYVEYRWSDLRSPAPPEVTGAEIKAEPMPAESAKLRRYLRMAAQQNLRDPERERSEWLAKYVAEANGRAGSWPGYYLHVFHELKNGPQNKDAAASLLKSLEVALQDSALNTDLTNNASRHRLSLGRLFRGRLLDLLDRRSEALYEYHAARRLASFGRVAKAAEQNIRRPYRWKQTRALAIDWGGLDLYQY